MIRIIFIICVLFFHTFNDHIYAENTCKLCLLDTTSSTAARNIIANNFIKNIQAYHKLNFSVDIHVDKVGTLIQSINTGSFDVLKEFMKKQQYDYFLCIKDERDQHISLTVFNHELISDDVFLEYVLSMDPYFSDIATSAFLSLFHSISDNFTQNLLY